MSYVESEMVYHDYKNTARADHDDPYYTKGQEHSELNRTELYEILYYINHLGKIWNWTGNPTSSYQKIERMIRMQVPSSIRTHKAIQVWLQNNWDKY
jgi:hypothetical protein